MSTPNKTKSPIGKLAATALVICFAIVYTLFNQGTEQKTAEKENTTTAASNGTVQNTDVEASNGVSNEASNETSEETYYFRNNKLLTQHFEKHGGQFDYATKEEYEAGADAVIHSPDALTKTESEDGDMVYYIEKTNEFVILSKDGYIRTYFKPDAGIKYFERQ